MASFDLLSEPWVPVLDARADLRDAPNTAVEHRTVGLAEALRRAHEIREVVGDTPLETISLNRLLLAVFADAHALSAEPERWWALWDAGRADADALDTYLEQHRSAFDLLHAERPFYQVPAADHPARDTTTLSQLRHAEAAGNNGTLFGHEMDDPPRPDGQPARMLALADAARSLVAYQAYGLGGLAGSAASGGRLPAFKHATLVSGAVFWLRGRSLFESLLLNATPRPNVWLGPGDDRPAWRRGRARTAMRRPEGLLDLLTWQARHVALATMPGSGGVPVAEAVSIANAETVEAESVLDPMMATIVSEKKGEFPYGLRSERAVWRDLDTLLAARPESGRPPETLAGLARLLRTRDGARLPFGRHNPIPADVFGVENDKSKMLRWRHDRAPVYPALLDDPDRLSRLAQAVADADEQGRSLQFAIRTTAEYLLSPPPPGADSKAKPDADKKTVSALAASLDAERRFWMAAEPAFFDTLRALTEADDADAQANAVLGWDRTLWDLAGRAFDDATSALDRSARHLQARARGLHALRSVERLRNHDDDSRRAPDPQLALSL